MARLLPPIGGPRPGAGGRRPGAGRPRGEETVVINLRVPARWASLLPPGETLQERAAALLRAEMERLEAGAGG